LRRLNVRSLTPIFLPILLVNYFLAFILTAFIGRKVNAQPDDFVMCKPRPTQFTHRFPVGEWPDQFVQDLGLARVVSGGKPDGMAQWPTARSPPTRGRLNDELRQKPIARSAHRSLPSGARRYGK